MNYIKSYKIFESLSKEDIREDITDICYELTDDGRFGIKIYDSDTYNKEDKMLLITLVPPWGENIQSLFSNSAFFEFSFNEVKDVVLRVIDYLGSGYKGCYVSFHDKPRRLNITSDLKNGSDIDINNITDLLIIYKCK